MHKHFKIAPALAVFALLLFAPQLARGCTCAMPGPRPCSRVWSAPVLFAGLVTEESKPPKDAGDWLRRSFRFQIEEGFRGAQGGTTVEVLTGSGGGDCGYGFVVGRRYLVYASVNDKGQLATGICTATKPLEQAAEEIEFIRGLPQKSPEVAIYGAINFSARDLLTGGHVNEPVREARVLVEGAGTRREIGADAEGKFQATGLPAGTYSVKVLKPERGGGHREAKAFELREKQCADLYFYLTWDAGVRGRVVGEAGEPVPRARVSLTPSELAPKEFDDYQKTLSTFSDEEGNYSFEQVPPGRYLVVVNAHGSPRADEAPFPRTFLPGVEDPLLATVVKVGDGEKLTDQDIRLSRRLVARELIGTVVWPDGRAAGKNTSVLLVT
ncbi:MAG: carboxypeptidase-like regulatory domain-containing protein [Acidobacteria bacterium]|nr:carboxypeptidase-like regulatory domain-containing protein [Acidobacteriota bacterium]